MKLNQQLLQINRNFLICFIVSASLSAVVAQLLSDYENYLNTTITIVIGYGIFFGQPSLFIWNWRSWISWCKMALVLLFSGDRNRAIPSLTNLRDYRHGMLYGDSFSRLARNQDILKNHFHPRIQSSRSGAKFSM